MALITRTAKGEKLTIAEMDGNLEYLQSLGLAGTNYIYVEANGTDVENAAELQAAYIEATTRFPSVTNRITIIAGVGYYNFGATTFTMDTEFIDLVSLDGNRSIIFNSSDTAGTISVTANDVFVKGVNVQDKSFTIADNLNLLKVENCIGGGSSFGLTINTSGTFTDCIGGDDSFGGGIGGQASGIFTDCVGGFGSFGGNGGIASGTFINCVGGFGSFGGSGTASGTFTNCQSGDDSFGAGGIALGTFTNCVGGQSSFGYMATASGTFTNCVGGTGSFGKYGTLVGKLYYCRLTGGTFQTVSGGGITRYCLDGTNTANNQG